MRPARLRLAIIALALLEPGGCVVIADDDDDAGTETAAAEGGTAAGDETGASACFTPPQCDPLAPACPGGKCVPNGGGFGCTPDESGVPNAGAGEPCVGDLDCQDGLVCLSGGSGCAGSPGCCIALCDLSQPQCPGGTRCAPFFSGSTPLCFEDVGLCLEG